MLRSIVNILFDLNAQMKGLVVLGAAAPRDGAIRLSCIRNTRLPMQDTPVLNIGDASFC